MRTAGTASGVIRRLQTSLVTVFAFLYMCLTLGNDATCPYQ